MFWVEGLANCYLLFANCHLLLVVQHPHQPARDKQSAYKKHEAVARVADHLSCIAALGHAEDNGREKRKDHSRSEV